MNSFVRNGITGALGLHLRSSTAKHSVERIDWALREIPGGNSLADAPLDEFGEHPGGKIKERLI
jgi:hypothetical protein